MHEFTRPYATKTAGKKDQPVRNRHDPTCSFIRPDDTSIRKATNSRMTFRRIFPTATNQTKTATSNPSTAAMMISAHHGRTLNLKSEMWQTYARETQSPSVPLKSSQSWNLIQFNPIQSNLTKSNIAERSIGWEPFIVVAWVRILGVCGCSIHIRGLILVF